MKHKTCLAKSVIIVPLYSQYMTAKKHSCGYLTRWHSGISFTLDSSQVALQSFDKIIHLGISSILYCAFTMLHRCYRDIVYTCQAVYWSIKGAKMAIKRIERENYENCWPSIQIFINCQRCRSGTSLRAQIIKRNCRCQQKVSIIFCKLINLYTSMYCQVIHAV